MNKTLPNARSCISSSDQHFFQISSEEISKNCPNLTEIIYPITWLYILGATTTFTALLYLVYKILKPINWRKDLTAIGYDHLRGGLYKVKYARRARKVGETLPPPFPNGWFGILESKELKAGEVRSVNCLGQNFAVMRTAKGEAAVLDAYCPHLGANMAIGGVVRDNCLECPFHQWRFSSETGKCSGVPYSVKGTVPKASVRKWECREVNGSIFVWHHVDPEVTPWEIPSVPEVESGSWMYRGRNEFYINCHIQEIPENGADIAHLNSVHGQNLFASNGQTSTSNFSLISEILSNFIHTWNAVWEPREDEDKTHRAVMNLQHALGIKGSKFRMFQMDVRAEQIGPGYVQLNISTSIGRMVILQTVTPVEPLVQKVVHRIYCPWYLIPYASFVMLGECIMFERDIAIWNHKKYMNNPHFLREEKSIKRYRTWYQQFYSDQSKTFREATEETLDW
ncbi:cholesterol 7-desaturase-like [Ctenocephalides felis]|uniref:cholesterol 7-desaturase-like n=1 Tax=Ctenocephalides felis TaxID=7515 RepID=UPI000E6E358F|nr:cholesterol 7-desaturase-like [Ctenocephalides felis]